MSHASPNPPSLAPVAALIRTFDWSAGSLRITQDLRGTGNPNPYLSTVVLDSDRSPAGDVFRSGEGTRENSIDNPPESYYPDIDTAGDVYYTVTVEQCEDDDSPSTGANGQDRRSTTGQT